MSELGVLPVAAAGLVDGVALGVERELVGEGSGQVDVMRTVTHRRTRTEPAQPSSLSNVATCFTCLLFSLAHCAVIASPVELSPSPFRAPQRDCAGAPARYPRVLGADSGSRAMATDNADDLVPFQDVRVIRSTAPALLCRIGEKSVWLPRGHISGRLWSTGDRGKLFIRHWVARDRHPSDLHGAAITSLIPSLSRPRLPGQLHLVRRDGNTHHAK